MWRITERLYLLLILFLLVFSYACQFKQNQSSSSTQPNTPTPKTVQTVPALFTVRPTKTHEPSPPPTLIAIAPAEPVQELPAIDSLDVAQLVTSEVPALNDNYGETRISEQNYNLTAAELANSGTNYYKIICDSVVGTGNDCTCGHIEPTEFQIDFDGGKLVFDHNLDEYYPFIKIAENTYQFGKIHNNVGFTDTFIFTQHGFARKVTFEEQSIICKIEISYLLAPDLAPIPTPTPEPIKLTKYGFGQTGSLLSYAFVVDNLNMDMAFMDAEYRLTVYDENNVEVGYESGSIELLFPQQSLGIAGQLSLEDGVTVSRIGIQFYQGSYTPAGPRESFQVNSTAFIPGETYYSVATGIIDNLSFEDFTDIRVFAIAYDEVGNIIGGGDKNINFLLGKDSRGIDVEVITNGHAAYVELYPYKPNLYRFANEAPPGVASKIQIIDYGYGQDEYSAGYGFVVENLNDDYAIGYSQYYVTAYSSDGSVLSTDEGIINLLLPHQKLGIGGYLAPLWGKMKIDHVVIQVKEGHYVKSEPFPLFAYENVVYKNGNVTGTIINTGYSPDDVDDFRVSAIAFNEDGKIIGGGDSYTFLDPEPEFESFTVEVWVPTSSFPSKVELFASVVIKSLFE